MHRTNCIADLDTLFNTPTIHLWVRIKLGYRLSSFKKNSTYGLPTIIHFPTTKDNQAVSSKSHYFRTTFMQGNYKYAESRDLVQEVIQREDKVLGKVVTPNVMHLEHWLNKWSFEVMPVALGMSFSPNKCKLLIAIAWPLCWCLVTRILRIQYFSSIE